MEGCPFSDPRCPKFDRFLTYSCLESMSVRGFNCHNNEGWWTAGESIMIRREWPYDDGISGLTMWPLTRINTESQ